MHTFPLQHQSGLYLDKVTQMFAGEGRCSNPSELRKPVTEANSLKPLVQSLEYHHYDDLDSILIRGENLWFLHQVRIAHSLLTQPQDVNNSLIQFSCPPTAITQQASSSASTDIEAFSHFSPPVTSSVPVSHKVSFVAQYKCILSWFAGVYLCEFCVMWLYLFLFSFDHSGFVQRLTHMHNLSLCLRLVNHTTKLCVTAS